MPKFIQLDPCIYLMLIIISVLYIYIYIYIVTLCMSQNRFCAAPSASVQQFAAEFAIGYFFCFNSFSILFVLLPLNCLFLERERCG